MPLQALEAVHLDATDVATLTVMSELTAKYRDARGMLLIGKLALARGYPIEHAAFPIFGVPDYTPIGPPVDPALVYSIVRQESWFNPKTVSSANALGLMQVTPAAGKYIAGKFKASTPKPGDAVTCAECGTSVNIAAEKKRLEAEAGAAVEEKLRNAP